MRGRGQRAGARWASITSRWTLFDPRRAPPASWRPTVLHRPADPGARRRRSRLLGWPGGGCPRHRSRGRSGRRPALGRVRRAGRRRGRAADGDARQRPSTAATSPGCTSSWTCIFGRGCRGIDAARPDDGCCTLGAHFTDAADEKRVARRRPAADRRAVAAHTAAWPPTAHDWRSVDDEGTRTTAVVDGACVFLNRPGFAPGSSPTARAAPCTGSRSTRAGRRTRPSRTCAGSCPLRRTYRTVERPDGTQLSRGDDRRVRPPRLGRRRPRPRLVLQRQPTGARRSRAGLPVDGGGADRARRRRGVRRARPLRAALAARRVLPSRSTQRRRQPRPAAPRPPMRSRDRRQE